MAIPANRYGKTKSAIHALWNKALNPRPQTYDIVLGLINQYLATRNPQDYYAAITFVMGLGYNYTQAESMLKFAFPEIDGGPGSGW